MADPAVKEVMSRCAREGAIPAALKRASASQIAPWMLTRSANRAQVLVLGRPGRAGMLARALHLSNHGHRLNVRTPPGAARDPLAKLCLAACLFSRTHSGRKSPRILCREVLIRIAGQPQEPHRPIPVRTEPPQAVMGPASPAWMFKLPPQKPIVASCSDACSLMDLAIWNDVSG